MSLKIYNHPQEVWDEAKCAKMAKNAPKDAYGNRPPKGIIACSSSVYPQYGQTRRWNGGTVKEGKLYDAEHVPFPSIPESYEFVSLPSWGTRIQLKND